MADYRKNEVRDFKERFEFKLTVGENIICQRYFKINNFNPLSLSSFELTNVMRYLADMVDSDLKDKSQVYLDIMAPMIFHTEEEMNAYYANPSNHRYIRGGHGIVVKENLEHDYAWKAFFDKDGTVTGGTPMPLTFKFDDGEFGRELTDEDFVEYKLSFIDNGKDMNTPKEVCSIVWTGVYPKYVRNSIDLSNKRGRFENVDVMTLGFDQYLVYKIFNGRQDLVYKIIKEIQVTCSNPDNSWYTTYETFKRVDGTEKVYKNVIDVKTA